MSRREQWILLGVLFIGAVLRLAALLRYGPIFQPDSDSFVLVAEELRASSAWLHDGRLSEGFRSATTFRMVGYPLLLAALQILFGGAYAIATVLLQGAVSLAACVLLFRLARALGIGEWSAGFAAFAYATGILFVYDQNILTDSLFANAMFAAIGLPVLAVLRGERPSARRLLAGGACLAGALLLRETALFFAPVWAVAIAAMVAASPGSARARRAGMACLLVLLLPVLTWQGYAQWNRYRTGHAFLTTGAQMTLWFGPVEVFRRHGPAAFADDPRILRALTSVGPDAVTPMDGARSINRTLFEEGMQAPAIGALAARAFVRAVVAHPLTFLAGRADRWKANNLFLLFSPAYAPEKIPEIALRERIPGFSEHMRAVRRGQAGAVAWAAVVIEFPARIVAATIWGLFVIGGPVQLWLRWRRGHAISPLHVAPVAFLACYAAMHMAYMLASFEERYAIGVIPLALLGGLSVGSALLAARRAARNSA